MNGKGFGKKWSRSISSHFPGTQKKCMKTTHLKIEQSRSRLKDTSANILITLLGLPQRFGALLIVFISLPHSGVPVDRRFVGSVFFRAL